MAIPIRIDRAQLAELKTTIKEAAGQAGQSEAAAAIRELTEVVRQGFALQHKALLGVKEALIEIDQPDSNSAPVKGQIMSRYQVPADLPDFQFDIVGKNFTDSEGNPTNAQAIDLSLEVANEEAITAQLGSQVLSEDGNEVRATVSVHVESPSPDMGVLMYKATNRNTGEVIAADSDEFVVSAGAAKLGTLESDIPGLTPEPEPVSGGGNGVVTEGGGTGETGGGSPV